MMKLCLDNEIYSHANITAAKEAYKDLARIVVIPKIKTTELLFTRCQYGDERTIKEFENYLIGLENQ